MPSNVESSRLSAIDQDVLTVLLGRVLYSREMLHYLNLGRGSVFREGSLYPVLNRLEERGLITWHWGEDDGMGNASRKYYQVTVPGAKVLKAVQEYRIVLGRRHPRSEG